MSDRAPASMFSPAGRLPATERLMSIDALRGLDMFFIIGMEEVFAALSEMVPMDPPLNDRLQHAPWAGFHFYDLIFPLFAFVMGTSLVFSLAKSVAVAGRGPTTWKIVRRSAILFLLGVWMYGGIAGGIEQVRLLGVLQRLALCYLAAGLAYVWMGRRGMVALAVGLLAGYWALLGFVPVPGFGAGDLAEGRNLTNWIDKEFLPFRKWDGDHDPEGLLSTLPAVATTLLGVFAGMLLRNPALEPARKVRLLLGWGAAGIALGLLWHVPFPIIKKLWTSSFVLLTAGIGAMLLGIFHQIVDLRGHRRWCRPFVWIGMNAITIYLLVHVIPLVPLARRIAGGGVHAALEQLHRGFGDLTLSLLALAAAVWICRFLFVRGIFLRV
ncbi:MAG: DUF5009 domain-containing protein [Akkermansiaceae bacterium]|nr:DUF5009 domain-containing protein [Akkermansiaceae bacterium]